MNTPTRDFAAAIARAVIDRIDTDQCCNSHNIGDAIFREMAVAVVEIAPRRTEMDVERCAIQIVALIEAYPELLFGAPPHLRNALLELAQAVEAGRKP